MTVQCLEHERIAEDGTSLFIREYPPRGASPAVGRTLLVVHGAAEHGGRYERFAQLTAESGWRVLVPDLRGHGRSAGVHTHVNRFATYLSDLTGVLREFHREPDRLACLGHSFGGLIVARLVQVYPDLADAAVLLSPFFGLAIQVPRLTLWSGRAVALVFPKVRFSSRIRPADLTQDERMLEERKQDPLIRRGVTAGWFVQSQRAMRDAFQEAPEMRIPLLILHGGQDQIADPLATQRWAEASGSRDKKLRIFTDHLHELLNEPDGAETAALILNWLNERIPSKMTSAE